MNQEKTHIIKAEKCGCGLTHAQLDANKSLLDGINKGEIPLDKDLQDVGELFKVLGDFTRTKIISYLRTGEHCASDIARQIGMTKSAVSHQLRVLRQSKIVKNRKSGRGVFYALDDAHISALYDLALEHVIKG